VVAVWPDLGKRLRLDLLFAAVGKSERKKPGKFDPGFF
jgi:hypothetical protein